MPQNPFPQDTLVAVYPSRAEADASAKAVLDLGVDPGLVRVADRDDQSMALVSEMRQETSGSWRLFSSGVMTGEQATGSAMGIPVGAAVGAVIGLVIGLVAAVDEIPIAGRAALGILIGALFGGVVGMVVGGGLGTRGPATPGAAQGVPVSVGSTDDAVRQALSGHQVMRIDLVKAGGQPAATLETDDRGQDGEADILKDHLTQPTGGDWSTVAPDAPRADDGPA